MVASRSCGSSRPTSQALGSNVLALALMAGWAIGVNASPLTASAMIIADMVDRTAREVTRDWNGRYVVRALLLIATVVIAALVPRDRARPEPVALRRGCALHEGKLELLQLGLAQAGRLQHGPALLAPRGQARRQPGQHVVGTGDEARIIAAERHHPRDRG